MLESHHIWWSFIIIFNVIAHAMACRPVRVQTGGCMGLNWKCWKYDGQSSYGSVSAGRGKWAHYVRTFETSVWPNNLFTISQLKRFCLFEGEKSTLLVFDQILSGDLRLQILPDDSLPCDEPCYFKLRFYFLWHRFEQLWFSLISAAAPGLFEHCAT